MKAAKERDGAEVELDDLRRRLYRAGATDADLQRYLDERRAVVPPEEPGPTPPLRRPRRWTAVVAAAGVVAICAAAIGVVLQQPVPRPKPTAAARAPHVVMQDIGDGRLLPVDPDGLTGPTPTAASIDGTASTAQRFDGIGDQVVVAQLSGVESGTDRAVLAFTSAEPSTISWRALRLATRMDWSSYEEVVAMGRVLSDVESATPARFTYAGGPPMRIVVQAPAGLHWTLLVAPENSAASDLH